MERSLELLAGMNLIFTGKELPGEVARAYMLALEGAKDEEVADALVLALRHSDRMPKPLDIIEHIRSRRAAATRAATTEPAKEVLHG